ncbi:LysR family transcriptional regulator [Azoarcus indigens]|uniref:LysR family transcriptional regulator n=1 Tax=Azoarcus indigens TaxID=29545 RepID=A0A4R6E152_9RHOO|nr:LysR substrate-binding domain-containing protein [Azoarcus indigens]NMG65567.1 LysR family transcriptional regulator [Azoarcus indigens]TDN51446.1 LysR family transcriptional regulator [Azoarcus indigens]
MHFDLADLKVFVAAAEQGSLTAAGRHCHLALAAVSKRIARLEEQTGSALFTRGKQGVATTPAGAVFLRHARAWLYDIQVLNAELQEHARGFRGLVRLAANTNAMQGFLPECIGEYLARNRQVDVRIEEGLSVEVLRRVAEGRADIGIYAATLEAPRLELFPFRNDRLVAVMAADHAHAGAAQIRFEQLLDEDFVGLDGEAAIQAFLEEKASGLGRRLQLRVGTRSFDAVCRFAQCGVGVAVVPRSAAERFGEPGRLAVVPLADDWAERRLQIAVRSYEALPAYARQLVDALRG